MSPKRSIAATSVRVHPWAYRIPVSNPAAYDEEPSATTLARDLGGMVSRMQAHGMPVTPPSMSRRSLTTLQNELRQATEGSESVASDPDIQRFRKQLHLLLDH